MTAAQQEILDALRAEQDRTGWPCSVRRLGELTGRKSSATVHLHLVALQKQGLVLGGRRGFKAVAS